MSERSAYPHIHRVHSIERDGRRKVRPALRLQAFPPSLPEMQITGERSYRDPRTGTEYDVTWNGTLARESR